MRCVHEAYKRVQDRAWRLSDARQNLSGSQTLSQRANRPKDAPQLHCTYLMGHAVLHWVTQITLTRASELNALVDGALKLTDEVLQTSLLKL